MKKVICWLFGHLPFTYNSGTQTDPEQSWACSYCHTDLTQGDEFWGFNLNGNITKWFKGKDVEKSDEEIPF